MRNLVTNIEENWVLGEPAKLLYGGNYVYGRFYEEDLSSALYGGKHAILFIITPGGTIVRTGRAYLEKLEDSEIEQLYYWENLQKKKESYLGLYGNKIVYKNNSWEKANLVSFKNDELEYIEENDEVSLKFKMKVVPLMKYFGEQFNYNEIDNEVLSKLISNTISKLGRSYNVLDTSITDTINIKLVNPKDNSIVENFINAFLEEIRSYYEQHETHITRMFGSYVLLTKEEGTLKAVKATPIPIKYCPLMKKLLTEVGGETAEKLLSSLNSEEEVSQTKLMCDLINEVVIKGGYFDSNRPLNSCEANVLFGASETMSSAFKDNLIDAAVIVSNNLGTIITTNASNTQGAVKRMTGLFYTSPSKEIMKTAYEADIIPVFPYTASIDQLAGVKKAISLGYKKIAVSVAADDNYLHEEISKLEKESNIVIYKFGLCSTGIDEKTANIMKDNADVIWSCASKQVKEYVEPNAIAQVGLKIPVHIMTKQGWEIIKNHLQRMNGDINYDEVKLERADDKPIFVNDKDKIKVLVKKNITGCTDCPHPCI